MDDTFKSMSDYEIQAYLYGTENAHKAYHEKIGRFVLGKYQNGRVLLTSLYVYTFRDKKQGWWDTFSLCDEELQNEKMYLFRITCIRKDKNEYPIFILKKISGPFGNEVCREEFLSLCLTTGLFTDSFPRGMNTYNYQWCARQVGISEYEEPPVIAKNLFDRFLANEISINTIVEWFNEPSDEAKEIDRRYKSLEDISEKYPELAKVLDKKRNGNVFTNSGIYDIVDFYYGKYLDEFYDENLENLLWIEKAEIAAKALNEKYAAKKAAEKAERKARKAALKAQKKG